MKYIRLYFFFLSIVLAPALNAQFERSTLDSLEQSLATAPHDTIRLQVLGELIVRSAQLNFNSRLQYAREYLSIAQHRNSPKLLLNAYNAISGAHRSLSQYDSGIHYANLAIDHAKKYGLNSAGPLATKANNLADQGQYDEAITYFLLSIKKLDSVGNLRAYAARNNLALIYMNQQEYEKAIVLLEWVLDLGERNGDIQLKAMSSHNLGTAHWHLGNHSKARSYHQTSLAYCIESNDSIGIAHNYASLATELFADGAHREGKNILRKSISIFEKINNPLEVNRCQIKLASAHLDSDELDSAYQLANHIYLTSENLTSTFYIEAVEILSRIHEKRYNYSQALAYHKLYSQLRDSTARQLYDDQVLALEKTLEKEQLENEKEALQAEQSRLDLVNKQQLRAAIGGIISIILIAIILFFSYQQKRRDNHTLAERNKKISRQAHTLLDQKKELVQLSNFKEALTHMIAHDLKNSLHSMLNISANQTSKEGRIVHRSSLFAYNLVANMLDVRKFEEARIKLSLQMNPMHELVSEAILQVRSLADARNMSIQTAIDRTVKLSTDKEMVVRVIINLLHNAIKYSPLDGEIHLSTQLQTNEVRLEVKDQGPGIPEVDLPHVFDKYWHGHNENSNIPSASGLGLAYCKLAMEAHGGSIEVESEMGEGACFTLHFADLGNQTNPSDNQLNTTLNDVSKRSLELSNAERATLQRLYPELSAIDVYEISKWAEVLDKLRELEINHEWIQTLRVALQTSDESLLEELLKAGKG